MRLKEKESDIQRTILDGLAAMRIFHLRMNSGAMFAEHGGKKRMLRFGRKGMADILAASRSMYPTTWKSGKPQGWLSAVLWIEVKRPGEKQTPDQLAFQAEVEAEGHRYLVARSWEDVISALK